MTDARASHHGDMVRRLLPYPTVITSWPLAARLMDGLPTVLPTPLLMGQSEFQTQPEHAEKQESAKIRN